MKQPPNIAIRIDACISFAQEGNVTPYQFAKMLPGVNPLTIKKDLMRLDFLYKRRVRYMVYAQHLGSLFAYTVNETGTHDIAVLPPGQLVLMQLYLDRRLTMKAGF